MVERERFLLVPTLRVESKTCLGHQVSGTQSVLNLHSHAERGNEKKVTALESTASALETPSHLKGQSKD